MAGSCCEAAMEVFSKDESLISEKGSGFSYEEVKADRSVRALRIKKTGASDGCSARWREAERMVHLLLQQRMLQCPVEGGRILRWKKSDFSCISKNASYY